jgi:hypothetical protein
VFSPGFKAAVTPNSARSFSLSSNKYFFPGDGLNSSIQPRLFLDITGLFFPVNLFSVFILPEVPPEMSGEYLILPFEHSLKNRVNFANAVLLSGSSVFPADVLAAAVFPDSGLFFSPGRDAREPENIIIQAENAAVSKRAFSE